MEKNVTKDTIFLTLMQLTTQILSLILNIFITRMLGSENLGLMSLIYAFFTFAIIISNGNIFVSTSRFVAEEKGKKEGCPQKIFRYSLTFSLILSITSAVIVFITARPISTNIIKNPECITAVRMLALSLPAAALGSCIKGYFHANRKVIIPAVSEAAAFLIKSFIMAVSAGILIPQNMISVYTAIAISTICSEVSCLIILLASLPEKKFSERSKASVSFGKYICKLIPIILNSYIPCILSTANDALVPVTLRQSGCNTSEALSYYGIFEAVVLPVIFFPSMLLSCLSMILVPEISKHRLSGEKFKNLDLISDVISKTIIYSIFIVSILATYGNEIGSLVSNESSAGKMIALLSPVIPFIYLEIVLEGIIKGLGKHSFSSLNYLAEYIVRISVLLICVPLMGFYGIAVSYYMSNIACNIARIIVISKTYDIRFTFSGYLLTPLISIIVSWQISSMLRAVLHLDSLHIILQIASYIIISLSVYMFTLKSLKNTFKISKDISGL